MSRFSNKEKQLFWNLKFHAVLLTNFSQLTLTLKYYRVMLSSWRHVISSVPKWKTHRNPAMIQHIWECSRNSPHPKVWNGAGILALPPPMPKPNTVVYIPFPHFFADFGVSLWCRNSLSCILYYVYICFYFLYVCLICYLLCGALLLIFRLDITCIVCWCVVRLMYP